MAIIHFLNVLEGDCTFVHHNSDRVSVIDVCNATPYKSVAEDAMMKAARLGGNFGQKNFPVNPIAYMKERGFSSVFRFILTHPDMDHMDGIKDFFEEFSPTNFWDTDNECSKDFTKESMKYNKSDWDFYTSLRDGKPQSDPKRLALHSGSTGQFFNRNEEGKSGGDGFHVLAPTKELVITANECDDYNDCSYVILYRSGSNKIIFSGDSHDGTWDHILENHADDVKDVDLLIAPHHGRDSGRSYGFLETVNPAMTFFGNARSEHLAYDAWNSRKLPYITNNQANCMVVDTSQSPMWLYVTNEAFAKRENASTFFDSTHKAYYCKTIGR